MSVAGTTTLTGATTINSTLGVTGAVTAASVTAGGGFTIDMNNSLTSSGLTIGGKTGTGSGHVGNWFVGFTPEYSCSIWHGKSNENRCAELFPALMADLEHDASKTFPECTSVVQQPYCVDSGKRLTMQCSRMEMGYYPASYSLEKCDMHFE